VGQFITSGSGYGWSLGAWGGYEIWELPGAATFNIYGNSFSGWNESGIVWVSRDINGNGLPDDTWYELKGPDDKETSLYKSLVTRRYSLTYFRDYSANEYGKTQYRPYWIDSKGRGGTIKANWPMDWGAPAEHGDSIRFTGTLIRDDGRIYTDSGYWGQYGDLLAEGPGYVDAAYDIFSTADAIHPDGSSAVENVGDSAARLFVKVHTAVFRYGGIFGEVSTEIRSGTNLPAQNNGFPMP
jgi:hypothetical protein